MKMKCTLGILIFSAILILGTQVMAAEQGYYFRLGTGISYDEIDTGGFNTAGSFNNTDSHWDNPPFLDLSLGKGWGALRTQLDFSIRSPSFVTASFPGLPAPTFFYDSKVRVKSLAVSAYYDFSFGENGFYEPFIGVGAGQTYYRVDLSDGVVFASDSDKSTSFFGTIGLGFKVSDQVRTEIGYRYYDLGEFNVSMKDGGGGNAGTFEGDLTAHDVIFGLRCAF